MHKGAANTVQTNALLINRPTDHQPTNLPSHGRARTHIKKKQETRKNEKEKWEVKKKKVGCESGKAG